MLPACSSLLPQFRNQSTADTQRLLALWGVSGRSRRDELTHLRPPPCRGFTEQHCPNKVGHACNCDAAARFYRSASIAAQRYGPEGTNFTGLRVFFLEGHTGPMNDMMSFLHDVLGVRSENIDGIVFLQGMLMRSQIDTKFMVSPRATMLGGNNSKRVNQYLTESSSGRAFTMPLCEKRGCRRGAYDDTLRREFADKCVALGDSGVLTVRLQLRALRGTLHVKNIHTLLHLALYTARAFVGSLVGSLVSLSSLVSFALSLSCSHALSCARP